jgi:hypothetical protein
MPDKPYTFSTHIGAACAKQFRTFADLAEKLNMDLTELMRQQRQGLAVQGPGS